MQVSEKSSLLALNLQVQAEWGKGSGGSKNGGGGGHTSRLDHVYADERGMSGVSGNCKGGLAHVHARGRLGGSGVSGDGGVGTG